jgi:hypothetical protein
MSVNPSAAAGFAAQLLDNNGVILSGGKIYTYAAGTTTPQATYTSSLGNTAHANPIILDSAGRVPGGEIWLTAGASYKFLIETSTGSLLGTYDDITGINDLLSVTTSLSSVNVSFLQAGANAVVRTAQSKMREVVSVTDFGAVGDGTGDLGIALQAAHDSLNAAGGSILIPAGVTYYSMSTGVVFTKPVRLIGDQWYTSEILVTVAGLTLVTTSQKLDVENINITMLGAGLGTTVCFFHTASSASHGYSTFRNNFIAGAKNCYYSQSTNSVYIDGNSFSSTGPFGVSILLENFVNPDIGDSFITNNNISGGAGNIGIQVNSTSGINFCNNKFNNELAHVLISVGANLTGNFLFSNNSFEGHTDYAIKLVGTTGVITKTLITGNQFSALSSAHVIVSQTAQNTVITGNIFNHGDPTLGQGIVIETGAKDVTITGNAFHQIASAVVTSASTSAGITASGNRFANDVSVFFTGDDGLSLNAPQREFGYCRFVSNTSDSVYVDACRVRGNGTVEVKIYGLVQGIGDCNYYAKYLVSGATPAAIIAPVSSGAAFDVQVASSGGFLNVGVKRAAATGSAVTVFVEVTVAGQITEFKKA